MKKLMTVAQVAGLTGLTDRYIRQLIELGILPAYRLGKSRGVRISVDDYLNFIESRKIDVLA